MLVSYRSGDMSAPKLDVTEALQVEAQHFADCIQNGTTPITDGEVGLRVVSVLEAATISIRERGRSAEGGIVRSGPRYGGIGKDTQLVIMNVPFMDLKLQYAAIRDEILPAVAKVLESAQFVLGSEVAAFEEEFAAFCSAEYGVAVNTGTSALHLALLAAGVGPGDEVITIPCTFSNT